LPTDLGLWADFQGEPLQTQPSALDLLNLLAQLGIPANFETVMHRFGWTFADKEEAVAQLRNTLCIREGDTQQTAKLARLLDERLVRLDDGRFGHPVRTARSAIVSWSP
jgi:hypothetical protein